MRYLRVTVRFAVLVLGFAVAAAPAVAAPRGTTAARSTTSRVSAELTREFQAGVDAYRLGKYDEARAHLDRAKSLDPRLPGPHRFLAAVAKAQRRWADCIADSRRALQLNPESREIAETRKLHDECRAADGRPAYREPLGDSAAISITANVTGATVRIGRLRYGGTPVAPRLIKPGVLDVEIEKPGYRPARIQIEALPAIITDIDVVLEPLPETRNP